MVASQNGWRANDRSVISTRTVPGTNVRLAVRNGAAGDLLLEVAARFDREVEDIDGTQTDDWGYAERNIRGSSTKISNHASGTAIDLNAPRHPLGNSGTFSADQAKRIRSIIAATNNVVRWGGDYSGRKDEMHFEINDGKTEQECADALARLRGTSNTAPVNAPSQVNSSSVLKRGDSGPRVKAWQEHCNVFYTRFKPALAADGIFGLGTESRTKEIQAFRGLKADGVVGDDTRRATNFTG